MKITVVMATYNGKKFLSVQLDSILNQTFNDFKLLIIDDCSTDSTKDILLEYQKKYPGIINLIFNEKNLGSRATFAKGVELVDTQYFAFSDQDDFWLPNKLEILYNEIIKDDNLAFVYSNSQLVDENHTILKEKVINSSKAIDGNNFYQIVIDNSVMGCSMLVNTQFAQKCLPFPTVGFHHDWYLAIMALGLNYKVKFIDIPLFQYRLHSANLVNAKKSKDKLSIKTYNRAKRMLDEINAINLDKISNTQLLEILMLKQLFLTNLMQKKLKASVEYWYIFFKRLKECNVVDKKIRKSYFRYILYSLLW